MNDTSYDPRQIETISTFTISTASKRPTVERVKYVLVMMKQKMAATVVREVRQLARPRRSNCIDTVAAVAML